MKNEISTHTIYSKNSGVELKTGFFVENGREYGNVMLRFFGMNELKSIQSIWYQMKPEEAFYFGTMIEKGNKFQCPPHKSIRNGVQSIAYLVFDAYEKKDNKRGYAMVITRDTNKINVPLTETERCFCADFLKHLSMLTSYEKLVDGTSSTYKKV